MHFEFCTQIYCVLFFTPLRVIDWLSAGGLVSLCRPWQHVRASVMSVYGSNMLQPHGGAGRGDWCDAYNRHHLHT